MSPYQSYVYAYPHKTAYRPLAPRLLKDVWAGENKTSLSLYVHIPFCTMRCGFCNLFTTANPNENLVPLYLDALRRQSEVTKHALGVATFAHLAIGGGTPTYLNETQLHELYDITDSFGIRGGGIETSPDTINAATLNVLLNRGVERVSIGVQSFIEAETRDSGRPQTANEVHAALDLLAGRVPVLNIDLIYGLPGQSVETWLFSLREALKYAPQELFLYPLYVRPLTGLGRSKKAWDDLRLQCYREAREILLDEGYEQFSMRCFRRYSQATAIDLDDYSARRAGTIEPGATPRVTGHPPQTGFQPEGLTQPPARNLVSALRADQQENSNNTFTQGVALGSIVPALRAEESIADTPPLRAQKSTRYCCQTDGMVGLGCGARSYTRQLHYSFDYAVAPKSIKGIITDYLIRDFETVDYGFNLDEDEQRRRYILQSILNRDGLDRFPDDLELHTLAQSGYLRRATDRWVPTPLGLESSDAIGPSFYSPRVQALMAEYDVK